MTNSSGDTPFEAEYEGQETGDRFVEVGGDGLAQSAGGVEGAGQGDVAHDGDVVRFLVKQAERMNAGAVKK